MAWQERPRTPMQPPIYQLPQQYAPQQYASQQQQQQHQQYPQQPYAGVPPQSFNAEAAAFYGLGAYRLLDSGKDYVQGNLNKFLAGQDVHYYFQLNEEYVINKLKIVLFPFFHRGPWTRIGEPTPNGISYRPPRYDINAPDLYIPLMAFATYLVLRCFALGTMGKFTPSVMQSSFTYASFAWFFELVLLKGLMFVMGSGDAPWLDVLAYSGYALVGLSLSMASVVLSKYAYYAVCLWTSICMAVFLVKTLKRVALAETRGYASNRHAYVLLIGGIAQVPAFLTFTML